MKSKQMLSALKNSMRGELESIYVYQNAMNRSQDEEVKKFFKNRTEEEKGHYNYLLKYYQSITNEEILKAIETNGSKNFIFSDNFKERIGSDQILFSAISVAILLEKDSFEYYQKCSDDADDKILKDFFQQMANWEKEHYDDLMEISAAAEKIFWQRNRFEPF